MLPRYLLLLVLVGCISRNSEEPEPALSAEEACLDIRSSCLERSRVLGCVPSVSRCARCDWSGEVPAERAMLCADGWLRANTCDQLGGVPEECGWNP